MKSSCKVFALLLGFAVTSSFISCSNCIEKESARTASPCGRFEAVMVAELCGGAAGSVAYEVYVVRKGKTDNYTSKERVLTASSIDFLGFRWSSSERLEIDYASAYIHSFVNAVHLDDRGSSSKIEVVIKKIDR
jgi:hypothetical protein